MLDLRGGVMLALGFLVLVIHPLHAPRSVSAPAEPKCLYVSASGDDRANGRSPNSAFASLAHAQLAMRAPHAPRRTCLLPGRYILTAPIALTTSDKGTSWVGIGSGLKKPSVSGANGVASAFRIRSDDVKIDGILFSDFTEDGILATKVHNLTVTNNEFIDIRSSKWSQGAVHVTGSFDGVRINANVIRRTGYAGIIVDNNLGDTIGRLEIRGNQVIDACSAIADCGAIHINDRGHTGREIKISGNDVDASCPRAGMARAIYLDDDLSNALVSGNHVRGCWEYLIQVHGGDHNIVSRNLFDGTNASNIGLYQATRKFGDYGMDGNTFAGNTVILARGRAADGSDSWRIIGNGKPMHFQNNEYFVASQTNPNLPTEESAGPD